jgi:hypothetical protein
MRDLIDSDESDCKAIARAFWHFQAIWIGGRGCRYPSVIAASWSHSMNALQAPGEVRVRHDGSASIGKLSAQAVGRTGGDRSVCRSTELGKNALRPGASSNEGI